MHSRRSTSPTANPLVEAEELLAQVFPSFEGRTRGETERAIRDFQATRGLDPHGRRDGETLDELRRAASWIRHEKGGIETGGAMGAGRRPAAAARSTSTTRCSRRASTPR